MPEVYLLGTGGMLPLKKRYLTSLYTEHNGKGILIDCGEGTQVAMGEYGLKMSRIELLLITHVHADHVTGLPGLLLSIGNCSRKEPLDIYLPESGEKTIKNLLSVCGCLPYDIKLNLLPEDEPSNFAYESIDPLLEISVLPLKHSIPCLGYSLTYSKKPVFAPEKAKSLDVPLKYWKFLHSGETVNLDDGRTICPEDVTAGAREPVKITYTTDTLPIDSIPEFARESDLFICEGMYGSEDKKQSMNEKGHMLMQDACYLAEKSKSVKLWLTHYSPAESTPEQYSAELKKIFPEVTVSRDGEHIII